MAAQPMIIGAERPTGDDVIEVRSPYDGRVVGTVAKGGPDHIDAAVAAARAARAGGALPTHQRAAILDAAARLIAERLDHFAELISTESAKPITTARGEAARAVDTTAFSAAVARTLGGELIPLDASSAGEGKLGFVKRVPIGVVAGISPFNFPLNLVCHKVMPAIAAGCPVVLKPASSTPRTALALAEMLIDECGLPPGWLNVVPCPGSVADRLVDHDDVAMITFTGSPEVGWSIRGRAARKKVSLELGNNSPIIIEADADWAAAAAKIKVAGYSFAGQSCISTQRVYVHESIVDDFTAELVRRVETIVVGDPADPATEVSALIDAGETDRVASWIDEAAAGGARVATGGDRGPDGVLRPTVLTDVTPDMKVCAQEVFGPVVAVARYTDLDDALALANDSHYGLQASVFTSSLATALKAADVLDYGGVLVNEVPTWRADHMPYGGVRDSGNTREGPPYAVREMTEERLVVFQP
ncbi:MAG TPA: aldehyde dehydrogenase family protein [Acidimicrobiales bacterium]|nr:aldehyde dehydrogenase family protein [Acidimicrobiales bacterium]